MTIKCEECFVVPKQVEGDMKQKNKSEKCSSSFLEDDIVVRTHKEKIRVKFRSFWDQLNLGHYVIPSELKGVYRNAISVIGLDHDVDGFDVKFESLWE